MLKINKIEHWYGIKKLINPSEIKGNTIIYSPNGVMKTSLSDGLKDIKSGENPKDLFNNIQSSFEIEFNDVVYTEAYPNIPLKTVIFSADDTSLDIYKDERILTLMLSIEEKEKYNLILKTVDNDIESFKRILSIDITKDNRYNPKIFDKYMISNKDTMILIDNIINFIENINYDMVVANDISNIKYFDIFDEKIYRSYWRQ